MSGVAADFPGKFPVLIGARSFAVNTSYEQFRRQSTHHDTIPSTRESINLNDVPGEGAINTEGLWRRGQISWHKGSGQLYLDRKDSDDMRFYDSKGVDPWSQNQLTLLPDTVLQVADSTTYNWCTTEVIGNTVFHMQSNANTGATTGQIRFTTGDYTDWDTPAGCPTTPLGMATDGQLLYCCSATGVYVLTPDFTSATPWDSSSWTQMTNDTVDHIWCLGADIVAAVGPALYNLNGLAPAGAVPTANGTYIMTHPNKQWKWLDATMGEAQIYITGVDGNPGVNVGRSTIFQIASQNSSFSPTQNITLQWGTVAYQLNSGEFCGTIYAYGGMIYLGTNLGIREARPSTANDPAGAQGLVVGAAQPNLTHPTQAPFQPYVGNFVSGIVGWGPFIWFSWPSFDGTSWGLGRLDTRTHLAELQPAYAPDLMVESGATSANSHHTLNWCPFTQGPLMIVPGADDDAGLYTQDTTKYVPSGTLRSGRITWGIPDMKTLAQANLKTAAANGYAPFDAPEATCGVTLDVAYDGGVFAALGTLAPNTQANPPVLISPLTPAEEVEIEAILTADTVDAGTRPFLTRWTAKALPNVVSGRFIFVAIMLYTENLLPDGSLDTSDPYGDYAYLEGLRLAQTIITYKEGSEAAVTNDEAQCVVYDLYWMPFSQRENSDSGFQGDLVVTLKTIVG